VRRSEAIFVALNTGTIHKAREWKTSAAESRYQATTSEDLIVNIGAYDTEMCSHEMDVPESPINSVNDPNRFCSHANT
jgi:hypothetical protein